MTKQKVRMSKEKEGEKDRHAKSAYSSSLLEEARMVELP